MEKVSRRIWFVGCLRIENRIFTPELRSPCCGWRPLSTHAFSGGTHTHQGVFCSMLGFPNLPGFEYLMQNIVSNQPFLALPKVLKEQGYQDDVPLYNGNLAWDNMLGFFRKRGVDRFIGDSDYVSPIQARSRCLGCELDQDVFDRANKEFMKPLH